MTETPQQSVQDGPEQPPHDPTSPQPGIDRANLRNYERLHRSVADRKIAGVAGGLGRHLNIDPTILRVLFVVLCFFGGAGFLLYGAAWLLVPEDGQAQGKVATSPATRNALLIAAGVIAALLLLGDSWNGVGFPWPVMLVGAGVLIFLLLRNDGPDTGADTAAAAAGLPWAPAEPGTDPSAPVYPSQTAYQPGYQPVYQPRPKRYRGPRLFGPTLALVALTLGAIGLYEASGGHVVDSAYPAAALAVVGVMLLVGAFVGRAGGLIFLGILAAMALAVSSVSGDVRGGDRLAVAPTTAAAVHTTYRVDSGRVSVDLGGITDPQQLDGRVIDVGASAGEVVLTLPPGVRSAVVADIGGPGQVDLPNRSSGGIGTHLRGSYGQGPGLVTFHTHVSVGHIDVRNP
jgi:phage shock protein PspC (stress-responsive transcriptional regulator)